MLHRLYSNKSSFKEIYFDKGVNIILADMSSSSSEKDSRNGVGKSSILEIVDFCLGGEPSKTLKKRELEDWTFFLEVTVKEKKIVVSRSVSMSKKIFIEGDVEGFPVQYTVEEKSKRVFYSDNEWKNILGEMVFGISSKIPRRKYDPSYRSLMSYFIRKGRDAYSEPFKHFRNQPSWQTQVDNCFLLGLSWEHARSWQLLKDEEGVLDNLKKSSKEGTLSKLIGELGKLEANKLRLKGKIRKEKEALENFKVHPQYKDLEQRANTFTDKIHGLSNKNVSAGNIVESYKKSIIQEKPADYSDISKIYNQCGVVFPKESLRKLKEVSQFHLEIVRNRQDFLSDEISKIEREVSERDAEIKKLSEERSEIMSLLESHGALDEYTKLQNILAKEISEFENINKKIELLKKIEEGKSSLRIKRESLKVDTRKDIEDRQVFLEDAIGFFNQNSEFLYNKPGNLIVSISPRGGFKFSIDIERSESDGIQLMEIFCYDLTLAEIWAQKSIGLKVLMHDSTIFADVDERQIGKALERALELSEKTGYQYICCLNSDNIPQRGLSSSFNLDEKIRVRLYDEPPEKSLFGFRF